MKKERILSRNFCFAFLALLCLAMVMYMLLSTITEYAAAFGASSTMAGLVSGAYIIAGLLTRLWSGRALSRMDWKKLGAAAAIIHLLACCGYYFVDNLALLLIIRFVQGLGFGAAANSIITIGMSILPKSRYSEANGYLMLAPTVAVAFGPLIGGAAYDRFGPYGCFTAAVILCTLTLLFLVLTDLRNVDTGKSAEETGIPAKGLNRVLEVGAIPISLCIFVIAFGYVAVMSFYRMYSAELGMSRAFSAFPIVYAVVLLILRPFAGRIQDRFGDNPVCYPGIFVQALGLICIAFLPGVFSVIICGVGCALGYGLLNSCCNSIACRRVPQYRRSFAVSTFWICCDVGMGLGPVVLGAVQSAFGSYPLMYCIGAGITLFTLPVYYFAWGCSGGKRKKLQTAEQRN